MALCNLVDVITSDDLLLTGAFYAADRLDRRARIVDAVLMVHGNGANFYSSYQRGFAELLAGSGYPVVTANTRGHGFLSMAVRLTGPQGYLGTSMERLDECLNDLDSWIAWLKVQGYRRILLWGHSRGAVKVAYYMAQRPDAATCAVLSSPPLLSHSRWMGTSRREEFRRDLARCEESVRGAEPNALIGVTVPLPYFSGAAQYLDTYGPHEKYNVLRLLENISSPALAITGTVEVEAFFPFQGLAELLDEHATRSPIFEHLSVPGGDHVYTGLREWVLNRVISWLTDGPPSRAVA
ncbi:alpha/beta hydrolase [Bradyrhizobium mercantei]|uniref:alpha/beta hydrolase n=1 Tax=Bradyrhizobium mercantei TaxID=1904807 RepID=UPI000976BF8D|nr:alpha/beta fold hydrolase [Bradyrhizobium mercantei]